MIVLSCGAARLADLLREPVKSGIAQPTMSAGRVTPFTARHARPTGGKRSGN